jgi:hypothetical protein
MTPEELTTLEKINSLILYFSEVQIKLMITKKVAKEIENNALAAASTKAGSGVNEIINILQSNFETLLLEDKTPLPKGGIKRGSFLPTKNHPVPYLTLLDGRKK